MPPLPSLTVVVPSYKRLDRLPGLVRTYLAQNADQVVVVLDGPHPGWQEAFDGVDSDPSVVVMELPVNRGLALVRIAGLQLATSDVVLLADDDVMPQPGLIDQHRQFHAEHVNSALLGYMPVSLPEKRGPDMAATFIYARDYENQVAEWKNADSATLLDSFWGGNASIPRDLYLRAEAYKPSQRLNYNEDLDLGLRLKALGAGCAFDPLAKALHLHSRGLDAFIRECLVRGEAVADFERRWDELPEQLETLVIVPETHNGLAARVQSGVGLRDTPGTTEALLRILYDIAGRARVWRVQDAVARFLRRALAIRGYRLAGGKTTPSSTRTGH